MEHVVTHAAVVGFEEHTLTMYIPCKGYPSTVPSKKAVQQQLQIYSGTRTHSMLSVRSLLSHSEDPCWFFAWIISSFRFDLGCSAGSDSRLSIMSSL